MVSGEVGGGETVEKIDFDAISSEQNKEGEDFDFSSTKAMKMGKGRTWISPLLIIGLFLLAVVVGVGIPLAVMNNHDNGQISVEKTEDTEMYGDSEVDTENVETNGAAVQGIINFQSVIDDWVRTTGGNKGVIVYDLDYDAVVGSYNAEQKFATASLYKLFVVYEGYSMLENGQLDGEQIVPGAGRTVKTCLDLTIRESNSDCAEGIWKMIGRERLNEAVQTKYGFSDFDVGNLSATPTEIMKAMKKFYEHPDFSNSELLSAIWDSFLNQPVAEYDWRQGLPKGFSENALVYNKVGWNFDPDEEVWTIYNDAAIVNFVNQGRHYIVVVMTNYVDSWQVRNFGKRFEAYFYENFR
ncbi:serine hydrolase [Candidatus Saccharibacteria bacterium]|nr:serine hydrolase [Candidatus Saccharibacteria bacterium]